MRFLMLSLMLLVSTGVCAQKLCGKVDCAKVTRFFNSRDKLPAVISECRWPLGNVMSVATPILDIEKYFTSDELKNFMATDSLLGNVGFRNLNLANTTIVRGKKNLTRWRKKGIVFSSIPYFSTDNRYALIRERKAEEHGGTESLRVFRADGDRWTWIGDIFYESFHE